MHDIIDAALKHRPQLIRRDGDNLVMVVSFTDCNIGQLTLKDWLLSDIGRTDDLLTDGGRGEVTMADSSQNPHSAPTAE
ncbi:MAG: hypothetical protein WDN69_27125 [Aliidongia sp.]